MNLFGWYTKGYQIESMESMKVSCKIGEVYLQCSVHEVSRTDMSCTIPTCRVAQSLMDMLNKTIPVSINNMPMEGSLVWYTIEESTYRIGIAISPKDRPVWRKVLEATSRLLMHPSARPASV
jgi:hypothetical protein